VGTADYRSSFREMIFDRGLSDLDYGPSCGFDCDLSYGFDYGLNCDSGYDLSRVPDCDYGCCELRYEPSCGMFGLKHVMR
jgi:hypothetical protein